MPETMFEAVLRVAKTSGGADQLPNQQDQVFLFSLVKALSICPQDQWESLPVSAHEWYNTAAKLNNESKPIPLPEGFRSINVIKHAPSPPIAPPQPAKTVPKANPVVVAIPEQKERAKRNKNAGILDTIRKTIILNPAWNAKQVHEYVVKNGYPDASQAIVAVNTGDVKRVLALVKELGYWKEAEAKVG